MTIVPLVVWTEPYFLPAAMASWRMPIVTMPTFSTPAPDGRVDDRHDLAVGHRPGADDEQRLVLARREELAELRLRLGDRHFLLVDGQPVSAV